MSYSAWWRYVGSEDWTELTSADPITWTQSIEQGKCNGPYDATAFVFREMLERRWWQPSYLGIIPQYYESTVRVLGPIQGLITAVRSDGVRVLAFVGTNVSGQPYNVLTSLGGDPSACVTNPTSFRNCRSGIARIVRPPGNTQPDNCGNCITTFSTGLVITAATCIEVTLTPPECPCCGEMLPVASSILTTLEGMI